MRFSDEITGYQGWEAGGFVHVKNEVPQEFIVQVVEMGPQNLVTTLELDEDNRGQIVLQEKLDRDRVVVIVAALSPQTMQEASYILATQTVE